MSIIIGEKNHITKGIKQLLYLLCSISAISLLKILIVLSSRNHVYNPQKIFIFHCIYMALGLLIIEYIQKKSMKKVEQWLVLGFVITVILLILVLFIGPNINGTKRWLSIMGISLQPSCFLLLFFPYINAMLLYKKKFIKNIVFLLLLLFLLMMEPDFGSSLLLIGVWLIQTFYLDLLDYFKKYLLIISPFFGTFLIVKGWYALQRIKFILKPTEEINQTNLALKAIRLSKLVGNKTTIYIPEMHNDYFFAAFTNGYGKLASMGFLLLWLYFLYYLLNTVKYQKNPLKSCIMLGSICLLGGQSLLHIFTNINLIPAKGISFPLISAGGSLLLANLLAVGLVIKFLNYNQ